MLQGLQQKPTSWGKGRFMLASCFTRFCGAGIMDIFCLVSTIMVLLLRGE